MSSETTLRSYSKWSKTVRNFAWLKDTVPGATDIDMLIERGGKFLIIEGKPWLSKGGVLVPYGQHRALYQLSQQPNTTVLLLGEGSGDTLHVSNYATAAKPRYKPETRTMVWDRTQFKESTKDEVREWIAEWWQNAKSP